MSSLSRRSSVTMKLFFSLLLIVVLLIVILAQKGLLLIPSQLISSRSFLSTSPNTGFLRQQRSLGKNRQQEQGQSSFYDLTSLSEREKRQMIFMALSLTLNDSASTVDWRSKRDKVRKAMLYDLRKRTKANGESHSIGKVTYKSGDDDHALNKSHLKALSEGEDAYHRELDDTLDGTVVEIVKPFYGSDWDDAIGGTIVRIEKPIDGSASDDIIEGAIVQTVQPTYGEDSLPLGEALLETMEEEPATESTWDDSLGGNVVEIVNPTLSTGRTVEKNLEYDANHDSSEALVEIDWDDTLDGTVVETVPVRSSAKTRTKDSINEKNIKGEPTIRLNSLPLTESSRLLQSNSIDGDVFDGYEYSQGSCPGKGSLGVPCAPDNLPQLCNKYDRTNGSFRKCFDACAPAFCCIHDADRKLNTMAPNCNTDENCPAYNWCYIAWWKLHDTIGPALFLRLEQDDAFYDIKADEIDTDVTGDPVFEQIFLHHFDDIEKIIADGTVNGEFSADNIFLNPEYWDTDI